MSSESETSLNVSKSKYWSFVRHSAIVSYMAEKTKEIKNKTKNKDEKEEVMRAAKRNLEEEEEEKNWYTEQYEQLIGKPFPKKELTMDEVLTKLKESAKCRRVCEAKSYRSPAPRLGTVHYVEWNGPQVKKCSCPDDDCTCKAETLYPPKKIPHGEGYVGSACCRKLLRCCKKKRASQSKENFAQRLAAAVGVETTVYNDLQGKGILNLRGAEFCVSRCIRYYLPGEVPDSAFLSEKKKLEALAKKPKDDEEEEEDEDDRICDGYFCTVSTQATTGPSGDFIIGRVSHVLFGSLDEAVMRDIEGQKLQISSYKCIEEPPQPESHNFSLDKLLSVRELMNMRELKNQISLLKRNIYSSIFEIKEKSVPIRTLSTQYEDNANISGSKKGVVIVEKEPCKCSISNQLKEEFSKVQSNELRGILRKPSKPDSPPTGDLNAVPDTQPPEKQAKEEVESPKLPKDEPLDHEFVVRSKEIEITEPDRKLLAKQKITLFKKKGLSNLKHIISNDQPILERKLEETGIEKNGTITKDTNISEDAKQQQNNNNLGTITADTNKSEDVKQLQYNNNLGTITKDTNKSEDGKQLQNNNIGTVTKDTNKSEDGKQLQHNYNNLGTITKHTNKPEDGKQLQNNNNLGNITKDKNKSEDEKRLQNNNNNLGTITKHTNKSEDGKQLQNNNNFGNITKDTNKSEDAKQLQNNNNLGDNLPKTVTNGESGDKINIHSEEITNALRGGNKDTLDETNDLKNIKEDVNQKNVKHGDSDQISLKQVGDGKPNDNVVIRSREIEILGPDHKLISRDKISFLKKININSKRSILPADIKTSEKTDQPENEVVKTIDNVQNLNEQNHMSSDSKNEAKNNVEPINQIEKNIIESTSQKKVETENKTKEDLYSKQKPELEVPTFDKKSDNEIVILSKDIEIIQTGSSQIVNNKVYEMRKHINSLDKANGDVERKVTKSNDLNDKNLTQSSPEYVDTKPANDDIEISKKITPTDAKDSNIQNQEQNKVLTDSDSKSNSKPNNSCGKCTRSKCGNRHSRSKCKIGNNKKKSLSNVTVTSKDNILNEELHPVKTESPTKKITNLSSLIRWIFHRKSANVVQSLPEPMLHENKQNINQAERNMSESDIDKCLKENNIHKTDQEPKSSEKEVFSMQYSTLSDPKSSVLISSTFEADVAPDYGILNFYDVTEE